MLIYEGIALFHTEHPMPHIEDWRPSISDGGTTAIRERTPKMERAMNEAELKSKAGPAYQFGWQLEVVPLAYALEAIAAEREACAKIASQMVADLRADSRDVHIASHETARKIAEAIKMRVVTAPPPPPDRFRKAASNGD